MREDYTDITVVLDRSGSMTNRARDTVGGFDQFIKEQQKVRGKATITVAQFDHEYEVIYDNVNIKKVRSIKDKYIPRGSTALLDAIARAIQDTGTRLRGIEEKARPARVLFVIITDGEENDSREFRNEAGKARIKEMIKEQEDKYSWKFVYMGANQDAIDVGGYMGFQAMNSMTFTENSAGISNMYNSLSTSVTSYRTVSGDVASSMAMVTEEDREKQKNAEVQSDLHTGK